MRGRRQRIYPDIPTAPRKARPRWWRRNVELVEEGASRYRGPREGRSVPLAWGNRKEEGANRVEWLHREVAIK